MTRYTVFVDTNILVSGIFFDGPEAKLLDSRCPRLVTAQVCEHELREVATRKADVFGVSDEGAHEMVGGALVDIDVVPEEEYEDRYDEAAEMVGDGNDAAVLAGVLKVEPDYFVTDDKDFQFDEVKEKVNVVGTRGVLDCL